MAAELTLAFLYTVGTKVKTVGGADKGWVQEERRVLLTSSRARTCPWVLQWPMLHHT